MTDTLPVISVFHLAFAFVPVAIVIAVMFVWSLKGWTALYALARMLIQLVLIGYVLVFIFESRQAWIVLGILTVMLVASSWIALHPIRHKRRHLYPRVLLSLATGGIFTLVVITQAVLELEPWYLPQFAIPIAGMIFANSMNTISLAAERFESEIKNGATYADARRDSLQAALIPITNMMFAVGLVSLPGMMTGQILSGVSPLIAVRYQIMVMCMMFGASGIAAVCYLLLIKRDVIADISDNGPHAKARSREK